jgi:hypothetical protein
MNINLSRLNLVNTLFSNLIYDNLKYHLGLQSHISGLVKQIESNINFLLTEYYFTNIIEFESVKKKITHMFIMLKNIFYTFEINIYFITKINHILNLIKLVIYPAHLNLNNTNKYKIEINEINEIKKIKKINFFHKPETFDIKNNFYDEEVDLDKTNITQFSSILIDDYNDNNKELQNNKNFVVCNKLKGNNFYNKIDFSKSYISI